ARAPRPPARARRRLVGVLTGAVVLQVLAGWFLLLGPQFIGGEAAYVVVSGSSMEPNLYEGDLVVVRRQPSYGPGDVVAFRVPQGNVGEGAVVIHRVVGGSPATGLVLRGDNRTAPDVWGPTRRDVVGAQWFSVSGGGTALGILGSPLALAAFAGTLAFLMVATATPSREPEEARVGTVGSNPTPSATWSCSGP
ncbi:MAG TPA: S24/S26 family peptidase, partial [Acidimicrobiales bacterium]|nr:S24/S26 family peptidase [Acidimicrobiales bacterium]